MSATTTIDLAPSEPRARRWRIVILLLAGMTINYIDRTALAVAAPVLERQLGLSKAMLGVVLSVFFWAYAAVQVPAGWIIDRFDIKRTYAWGFAMWCLTSAATGLSRSVLGLSFFRGALALGESVSTPASNRIIRYLFAPAERGFPTGVYTAGTKLGPAIGTPICALLLVHYGWRSMFVLTGACGLLWLAPWLYLYRDPPRERSHKLAGGDVQAGAQPVFRFFRLPAIWGIFLGYFCYGYVWHIYATWLPAYLVSERKMSMVEMGMWGSLPFASFAIVIPMAGWTADRVVRRGWRELPVRKGFVSAGLFLGTLIIPGAFVSSAHAAVLLFAASTAGLGLTTANIWVVTQSMAPDRHVGTWIGIQNFGGVLGAALAPLVTGLLASYTGSFATSLTVAGVLSFVGILCYVFLIPSQPNEKEDR